MQPTPRSTLFPYTTLFRSRKGLSVVGTAGLDGEGVRAQPAEAHRATDFAYPQAAAVRKLQGFVDSGCLRSEEHTSELQSLRHLVCRLLLEKKKKISILSMS